MSEEEFITKFYSCDNEEQFLKDIYHNLNCLQQKNQQLKEQINEYKRLGFKQLQDKNNKLEHNWNQLKKFLELRLHENCNLSMYGVVQIRQEIEKAILKMQELERGVSDAED